jgi:hypothetical protein
MAVNYEIDYNDERFTRVETDKQEALSENEKTYSGMINESDKYYQAQIDASKNWAETQKQNQQEQTDFTIEQIEQQKEQANKDYIKEQSGSYVDWQKQSNQYGANAEKMAANGFTNTGYSESSQVSMYNTYQNRVATARESYNQAVLSYNNAIKDARLQNNAALAEIAYTALQQQLELSLQGFQYKNQLILAQADKKMEIENTYYNRYKDVLAQINTENALKEEVRQYDQNYALEVKKYNEDVRQFNQNYNFEMNKFNESIRQFNEEIKRLKEKDAKEYKLEIEKLELQKKQVEEAKRQFEAEQKLKKAQLNEQKRQFNAQQAAKSSGTKISKSPGGDSSKGASSAGKTKKVVKTSNGRTKTVVTSNKSSGGGNSVDMQSVLSLGYGPISAARAYELVQQGLAETYTKNGKTYFRKSAKFLKNQRLFG